MGRNKKPLTELLEGSLKKQKDSIVIDIDGVEWTTITVYNAVERLKSVTGFKVKTEWNRWLKQMTITVE